MGRHIVGQTLDRVVLALAQNSRPHLLRSACEEIWAVHHFANTLSLAMYEDANTAAAHAGGTAATMCHRALGASSANKAFACRGSCALRMWDCDWSQAHLLSLGYLVSDGKVT